MATVQRFEDLLCWKKSRELTKDIYKTFAECKDRGFRLKNRAEECSRLIASFIKSVKSSPNTGLQRKREMSSDERKAVDFELHMKRELARSSPKLYGKGGSVADYSAL